MLQVFCEPRLTCLDAMRTPAVPVMKLGKEETDTLAKDKWLVSLQEMNAAAAAGVSVLTLNICSADQLWRHC